MLCIAALHVQRPIVAESVSFCHSLRFNAVGTDSNVASLVAEAEAQRGEFAASLRFGLQEHLVLSAQPCRLTIALIQIGAKGDVQPFDTG